MLTANIKDLIKIIVVLGTLALNALLVYILLYDPFSNILVDKNQPYKTVSSNIITTITLIIIAIIIITSFILLLRVYKRQSIFIYAPLFSVIVLVLIIVTNSFSSKFPSGIYGHSENGYYYIEETWDNMPDKKRVYKRWKSIKPINDKSNIADIKYMLDSLSITTTK